MEQLTPKTKHKYVEQSIGKIQQQHREDKERWRKDFPSRQPGHSLKTDKSYSRVRMPSVAFRDGYALIDWNAAPDPTA